MKSILGKAGLCAAVLVVCSGRGALASTIDVKVPFAFVVQGQTLPAGEYQMVRDANDPAVLLIRGEKGNRSTALAMTRPAAGHDPAGDTPAVTFTRVENQYRLSGVWDSGLEGHEIVSR
jgi:alkylation response protein AidB-like acyl-CoA dehydrogenase